jgi:MFS family permease
MALIAIHIGLTVRRARRAAADPSDAPKADLITEPTAKAKTTHTGWFDLQFLFALASGVVFAAAIVACFGFREDSRLVPLLAAVPGLICALVLLVPHLRNRAPLLAWAPRGEWLLMGLFVAMIAAIPFVGFYAAVTAFMLILLATRTSLRWMLVPYVAALLAATWALSRILNLPLP